MKKKEYYSDILNYIEMRLDLLNNLDTLEYGKLSPAKADLYQYMIDQCQRNIDNWLESEVNV